MPHFADDQRIRGGMKLLYSVRIMFRCIGKTLRTSPVLLYMPGVEIQPTSSNFQASAFMTESISTSTTIIFLCLVDEQDTHQPGHAIVSAAKDTTAQLSIRCEHPP